jgi:hypothetical protein
MRAPLGIRIASRGGLTAATSRERESVRFSIQFAREEGQTTPTPHEVPVTSRDVESRRQH